MLVFVVLYYAELVAGGPSAALGTAVGLLAIIIMISVAQLTAMAALRTRVIYVRIGGGRVLTRRVSGGRMWAVCALPIVCVAFGLPQPERVARDVRTISALVLAVQIAGGAVGATLVLHGLSAAFFATDVAVLTTTQLMARAPESGRPAAARLFLPATADRDPLLASPTVARANHAVFDAHFGDVTAARAILAQLGGAHGPASIDAGFSMTVLSMEILAAEGRFAEAAQVPMPAPEPPETLNPIVRAVRRSAYSARVAKYLMLAAESATGIDSTTGPLVSTHLQQAAQGPTAAGQERGGRSLYALAVGDIKSAAREARVATARARTPLMLADAYCTQARVAAAQGKRAHARRLLAKAHGVAPWYPRIAVVNGVVTSTHEAATVLPSPDAPTDRLFTDPWSAQ
jgi:hypothetical protein